MLNANWQSRWRLRLSGAAKMKFSGDTESSRQQRVPNDDIRMALEVKEMLGQVIIPKNSP